MNLPFSPTFFRKMDVFQQLMECESQKDKKHLWEGEKAFLIWAASDQHQHLGSPLEGKHVMRALKYCREKGYISEHARTQLQGNLTYILENLIIHEFGERVSNPAQRVDLTINRNGILAGGIFLETDSLNNPRKYKLWKLDWYLLYYLAGILLFIQVLKAVWELLSTFLLKFS